MSNVMIVVEGKTDELILKAILPADVSKNAQFVVGSGRYSAQSLARTILAYERQPVALVLDADTTDESSVKEQLAYVRKALGEVAFDLPYEAFLAVPTIEAVIFESKSLLEKLVQRSVSQEEWDYAKTMPRKVLGKIGTGDYRLRLSKMLRHLDEATIKELQQHPLINQLCTFLCSASAATEQDAIAA